MLKMLVQKQAFERAVQNYIAPSRREYAVY